MNPDDHREADPAAATARYSKPGRWTSCSRTDSQSPCPTLTTFMAVIGYVLSEAGSFNQVRDELQSFFASYDDEMFAQLASH